MLLREQFSGTGVAIVTPFNSDGTPGWTGFEKVINHIINGGCEYLVVLGTTGESSTIHGAEKQAVLSFVNQVNAGRVPLVAGIGGNDTHEVLENFKAFDLTGYQAILTVGPYYNRPSQEGIYQHYKAVSDHAPLPVIMYNVPGRTGQNITADTQLRIACNCKKIFATKEASGNFEQVMQIIKNKPAEFMVISGEDGITLPLIACGAEGVISVAANAFPADVSAITRLCLQGKFAEALPLHYRYTDIINSMFTEGSPSGVKAYLAEMGLCGDHCRLPVVPVSTAHRERIKALLQTVTD